MCGFALLTGPTVVLDRRRHGTIQPEGIAEAAGVEMHDARFGDPVRAV
jgi:hypothetical protein